MRNRAVRVAVFLLAVLAFGAAGYELALLDRQAAAVRDAGRAFAQETYRAEALVRDARAAQFAYVADGQGSDFWTARAAALLAAIGADLQKLCNPAGGLKPSAPACTSASAALDDLATVRRIDASAQRYIQENQRLLASDLVFGDLREADQALTARIEEAREHQAAADEAAAATIRRTQMATSGGAAIFAVLVLCLLLPAAGPRTAKPAEAPKQSPAPIPAAPTARRVVDLSSAAALCTDFARLRETAELPALLERVAALLHAAGIVVWVHDASSGELRPALSHGYPPQALARMHAVSSGDDNATASAFRERRLRVVEGDEHRNGAIAAPLVAPDGCVGVMAAEIRRGREKDDATQALATIVAAQLATLVTPQAGPGVASSEARTD